MSGPRERLRAAATGVPGAPLVAVGPFDILALLDERDALAAKVARVEAALRVSRVVGGVSCGGQTVDAEGCFAANLSRRVRAALEDRP